MKYKKLIDEVIDLSNRVKKVYVYGAGFYGQDICRILMNNGVIIEGFLVTKEVKKKNVLGLPVYLSESLLDDNIGIVIGLSDIYTHEVINFLKNKRFNMKNVINGGIYISLNRAYPDIQRNKLLEVSTMMGCTVNCKFCPQDVLLKTYYKNNKNRQRVMTLENFNIILKNTPPDCIISFAAMTEPFNNPNCLEMIELACNEGRKVFLFSTFASVDEATVNKLIQLPIYHLTLHCADRYGYAHIILDDSYYRNIEKLVNASKNDGRPFVDFANAQAEPDKRVAEILRGKCEIMCSLQDRAGNLHDDVTECRTEIIGPGKKIKCCCNGDNLSNNVVLPDGTMILCSSDFGMKHVLGNLYEEDYDTIRSKGELQRVLKEMDCGSDMNLLCRSCLLARIIK